MRRIRTIILTVSSLCAGQATGQTPPADAPGTTHSVPSASETELVKKWSFSVSGFAYFVPESRDYFQPTVTADRDWLHLEGRYNYEAWETGSAWVGYNFGGGKTLAWEFTPMLGGVFGELTGIAPGYHGSLSWWKLELYSEGEYVVDTGDPSASFFYNWSELTLAPLDWFRFGMVTQRTRLYQAEREIQRGLLLGFSYGKASLTAYVFNPDESRPLVVAAVGYDF